jgi:hypothetical protein
LIDVLRGVPGRLTTVAADEGEPVWSPDGQELAFTWNATNDEDIFRLRLQRSEPAAPLPGKIGQAPAVRDTPEAWIREANTLLFLRIGGGERGLWAVGMATALVPAETLRAVVQGPDDDDYEVTSDGRRFLVKAGARTPTPADPCRPRLAFAPRTLKS